MFYDYNFTTVCFIAKPTSPQISKAIVAEAHIDSNITINYPDIVPETRVAAYAETYNTNAGVTTVYLHDGVSNLMHGK
jgi:hypothetical protein